jgi:rhamnosyltransferase
MAHGDSLKIIPIIVWYNPDKLLMNNAVENILTYSNFFEKIIIIDNSLKNNIDMAMGIPNSIYLANYDNLGIAKALNQGCGIAKDLEYDWVLTMDQDSKWTKEGDLLFFLSEVNKLYRKDKRNVSFSPNINTKISTVSEIIHKLNYRQEKDNVFLDRTNTSGNIFKLEVWKTLGGFNESLFIDEVDYEYCYRLKKCGYNIIKISKCCMDHVLGDNKKYFFPHICQHSKERIYYIMRNMYYIKVVFPEYYKKFNYRKYIIRTIVEKLVSLRFLDLYYIYRGINDSKSNKFGRYC